MELWVEFGFVDSFLDVVGSKVEVGIRGGYYIFFNYDGVEVIGIGV